MIRKWVDFLSMDVCFFRLLCQELVVLFLRFCLHFLVQDLVACLSYLFFVVFLVQDLVACWSCLLCFF